MFQDGGRRRQQAALRGEDLPEEDPAGAHPAEARHLHRLRAGLGFVLEAIKMSSCLFFFV